jgi:hypothetical protein
LTKTHSSIAKEKQKYAVKRKVYNIIFHAIEKDVNFMYMIQGARKIADEIHDIFSLYFFTSNFNAPLFNESLKLSRNI